MNKLICYLEYLFGFDDNYSISEKCTIVMCRIKGHPNGVIWYNPVGTEPDTHCKDCGEEI